MRGLGCSAATLVLLLASGCSGAAGSSLQPTASNGPDELFLDGLVIDAEIVPIGGARVLLEPGHRMTNTSDAGLFRLGPLDPGDYQLFVEKPGYANAKSSIVVAQTRPDRATIVLTPLALSVPYHITSIYVAYIQCTVSTVVFAPCVPLNVLTGRNITPDRAEFNFRIPAPGLADLLHEMMWRPQSTGHDMTVTIRDPSLALVANGVTVIYVAHAGGPPLRTWVVTGRINTEVGGTHKFDGNESRPYTAIIRGDYKNSTTPYVAAYVDHRVNNYFTFFYNRPGPRDFTVIPDS
jgi:hypothetical protein